MRAIWTPALALVLLVSPAGGAEPSLSAPDQVTALHPIRIEWTGAASRYDVVQLFDGEGKRLGEQRLGTRTSENPVAVLPAPKEPGRYELRFFERKTKTVLARRPIEVVPGTVEISGPTSVQRAGTVPIDWKGPGGEYDMVRIFDPDGEYGNHGELQIIRERRVRADDFEGRRVTLVAPSIPGDYELQYFDGRHHQVLARQPIVVRATRVSVEAPDEVGVGETLTVGWVGPAAKGDEIQITDPKRKALVRRLVADGDLEGKTVDITAPKVPGTYVVRYWSAANRLGLASRPLAVVGPPKEG